MNKKHESPKKGLEGILDGLGDVLKKLNDLAETGEKLSNSTEFQSSKEGVKGVFGFSVNVGSLDKKPKVEPFGNIRKDKTTGKSVVQEVREPLVDVFEEKDHILVLAEMPGIGIEDIHIDLRDDLLSIKAESGPKKYRKEVLLPKACSKENIAASCNNGILEIKCNC